jgi:hypothetical protein
MQKSYTYIPSEPGLWTVGFYTPDGAFVPESDHGTEQEAETRARWLSGLKAEYVYRKSDGGYQTGYYDEFGAWNPVYDGTKFECAVETHRLNGAD